MGGLTLQEKQIVLERYCSINSIISRALLYILIVGVYTTVQAFKNDTPIWATIIFISVTVALLIGLLYVKSVIIDLKNAIVKDIDEHIKYLNNAQ